MARSIAGAIFSTVLIVAVVGCRGGDEVDGEGSDPPPESSQAAPGPSLTEQPVPDLTSSSTPPSETSPPEEPESDPALIPEELVGMWVSTGDDSAELVYRFNGDGSYEHAGVLLQQRATGMFSFTVAVQGIVTVIDDTLLLQPMEATQTIEDPDDPASNGTRPMSLDPEEYNWKIDEAMGTLYLTSAGGNTVEYGQQ